MENKTATIDRGENTSKLLLKISDENLEIILTEDNPNNIKSVFNNLLRELKKGLFQFTLEDEKKDLYYEICKEYLIQLNAELKSVHQELSDYNLLEEREFEL